MNFIETIERGKEGKNKGLPTGLKSLNQAIGGVKKKSIYAVCAGPKIGKTTFTDFCFVIHPFLYLLEQKKLNPDTKLDIVWHYFSYEISRINKEFDFAAFFFFHDYQIFHFIHNGKKWDISPRYLKGEMIDDDQELIMIQKEHEEKLLEIYRNRIIPLFGEYNDQGVKISNGYINFIEERDNPTGMRNYLLNWYKDNGTFIYEPYYITNEQGQKEEKQRMVGYRKNNSELFHIVITDHRMWLYLVIGIEKLGNIGRKLSSQKLCTLIN